MNVTLPRLPVQKYYLKVRMCCAKCKEKVEEGIWEVPGVFDITVEKIQENKVVVTVMPWSIATTNLDLEDDDVLRKELLRKARKIDCRAQFLPSPPPPPIMPTSPIKPTPRESSTPPLPPPSVCYRRRWPCTPCDYGDPSCTLFYFFFLLFLLVSMIVFSSC
jgi:copper chaperone CopZ